ncbi:unnamed protein product [Prorocentrum cordatum]|uniref:Transmembrane protein 107 n=1 Tax=Prorocentrum cordatum TaxID=2364126 RepID=A0ABN9VQY7_9DINO|nr:unnamed protein product [Polarella glacialis]
MSGRGSWWGPPPGLALGRGAPPSRATSAPWRRRACIWRTRARRARGASITIFAELMRYHTAQSAETTISPKDSLESNDTENLEEQAQPKVVETPFVSAGLTTTTAQSRSQTTGLAIFLADLVLLEIAWANIFMVKLIVRALATEMTISLGIVVVSCLMMCQFPLGIAWTYLAG